MSARTSTQELPASTAQAAAAQAGTAQVGTAQAAAAQLDRAPRAWRILALVAVCLGLAALAAATFVLSYSGIRAVALEAGITPRLARGYPLLVDAMLVIALAAVLALRGAGLPSKMLAWLTLLVVLAAAAGADALHAAGRTLPHRPAAITAAVLPWALVLIAFALLLAMLRHARLRRAASARASVAPHGPARAHWQPAEQDYGQHGYGQGGAPVLVESAPALELPARPAHAAQPAMSAHAVVNPVLTVPRQPGPTIADSYDSVPAQVPPELAGDTELVGDTELAGDTELVGDTELAGDAELAGDDPSTDEAATRPTPTGYDDGDDDPDMPVFHRMWSAPTPPGL